MFYGFDANQSYTKKDLHNFTGDEDLRIQDKLSKMALGYCAPLALETNGTLFDGSKLYSYEKPSSVKNFLSVFSQRLVSTAIPITCQICECIANNNGMTKMECTSCDNQTPATLESKNATLDEYDEVIFPLYETEYNQSYAEED
ncbi:uncharacterized protein LOC106639934 [Copidosoma floridanum]|uniref:uncharacterized protein LOC106639934 n=1 Tax=Copidosoma floridanum TaxID=29053 RepID=UPI0006C95456|nr:uncharacterized protein LOC106639934 [Copidosoma floridanum]